MEFQRFFEEYGLKWDVTVPEEGKTAVESVLDIYRLNIFSQEECTNDLTHMINVLAWDITANNARLKAVDYEKIKAHLELNDKEHKLLKHYFKYLTLEFEINESNEQIQTQIVFGNNVKKNIGKFVLLGMVRKTEEFIKLEKELDNEYQLIELFSKVEAVQNRKRIIGEHLEAVIEKANRSSVWEKIEKHIKQFIQDEYAKFLTENSTRGKKEA